MIKGERPTKSGKMRLTNMGDWKGSYEEKSVQESHDEKSRYQTSKRVEHRFHSDDWWNSPPEQYLMKDNYCHYGSGPTYNILYNVTR